MYACVAVEHDAPCRSLDIFLEDTEDVVFAHDEVSLADQLHIGPGILRDQDVVAGLDRDRSPRGGPDCEFGGGVLRAIGGSIAAASGVASGTGE